MPIFFSIANSWRVNWNSWCSLPLFPVFVPRALYSRRRCFNKEESGGPQILDFENLRPFLLSVNSRIQKKATKIKGNRRQLWSQNKGMLKLRTSKLSAISLICLFATNYDCSGTVTSNQKPFFLLAINACSFVQIIKKMTKMWFFCVFLSVYIFFLFFFFGHTTQHVGS